MKKCFILLFLILSGIILSQDKFPKREFRGAWIATVKNIDWPTTKYLSTDEQIKELVSIFDRLQEAGINAVFLQVRSECDAMYYSRYEPWSYWLTGEQGKAPDPYWDPLHYAITEAHSRGMELHAWFNPFRTFSNTEEHTAASNHVLNTHPEWILQFGTLKILNPGLPQVNNYIQKIVDDVLTNYDVDGIHFDDYFYPYTPVQYEDTSTFNKYKGRFTNIKDWRRNNINSLVEGIYKNIQQKKPWVKFGVSPFGIIENKYAGTSGFESYNVLYNDPITWINNKTVDYVLPQIYWEIGHNKADFAKLLPWWASITKDRHLYIGHFASRIAGEDYKGLKRELGNQLRMNRSFNAVNGAVYFSAKAIYLNYSGLADSMKNSWFKYPAFPPAMPWKDIDPPSGPSSFTARNDSGKIHVEWKKSSDTSVMYYLLYRFDFNDNVDLNRPDKIIKVLPFTQTSYRDLTFINEDYRYVITAVDRLFNESKPVTFHYKGLVN